MGDAMVNRSELSFTCRDNRQAKDVDRLEPKTGTEGGTRFRPALSWARNPSGGKREPKASLSFVWNMVSPYLSSTEESRPQGRPTEMRVKDVGESERRAVMARIRGETSPDAKAG